MGKLPANMFRFLGIVLTFTAIILPVLAAGLSPEQTLASQEQSWSEDSEAEEDNPGKVVHPGVLDLSFFAVFSFDSFNPVAGEVPYNPSLLYVLGNLRI